jgi:hypothetical protein
MSRTATGSRAGAGAMARRSYGPVVPAQPLLARSVGASARAGSSCQTAMTARVAAGCSGQSLPSVAACAHSSWRRRFQGSRIQWGQRSSRGSTRSLGAPVDCGEVCGDGQQVSTDYWCVDRGGQRRKTLGVGNGAPAGCHFRPVVAPAPGASSMRPSPLSWSGAPGPSRWTARRGSGSGGSGLAEHQPAGRVAVRC